MQKERYFFEIAYKGTSYHGWQRQPNVASVQETIESTITRILKIKTSIHGCGRTDAGVHASQFFFHTDLPSETDIEALSLNLNRNLPPDITHYQIRKADIRANAQRGAQHRTYLFFVHFDPDPFLADLSFLCEEGLDIVAMEGALDLIKGKHDFRYFSKSPDKMDNTICVMEEVQLVKKPDGRMICFRFTGNRFLHNMIRLLVGNLLKLGAGKLTFEEFQSYLALKEQPKYYDLAHPQGLYLSHIVYPFFESEIRFPFEWVEEGYLASRD